MSKSLTKSIIIGSDHAGFLVKEKIKVFLKKANIKLLDIGTFSEERVDYPDYAHLVSTAVEKGEAAFGILLCGSANGVAMTANKHVSIRAGLCWQNDVALLVRQHNNANILCIPARFVSYFVALQMLETFMNTAFEGGRHATRVNKISCSL